MEKDKSLKQAKEEYDKIMADEHERSLMRLREKYILDQNTLKQEGINHGIEIGRKERTKGAEK